MPKILFKILIWLLIAVVLFVGIIIGGTILLKDKLIQRGIEAINEELNAPVQVEGITFSLINSFPYASIVLNNVTVLSPTVGFNHKNFAYTTADTLLSVRKLVLSFNTKKLLDNELELQSVKISDGQFFILIDDKGNDNFHIIKQKKEQTESLKMKIELSHLGFSDCVIQIDNRFKSNGAELYLPDFEVNGSFNDVENRIQTKGSMTLQWVAFNKMEIVPLAPTNIKMELGYRNDSLIVTEGRLASRGIDMALSGVVVLKTDTYLNLQLKGRKISVANALQYFTLATREKPKISSTGLVDFSATIRGRFDKRSTPLIKAQFGLNDATIKYPDLDLTLNHTNLNGTYNNGGAPHSRKSFVDIERMSTQIAQTQIVGSVKIDNLSAPHINAEAKIEGRLEDWNRFIFNDLPDQLAGYAAANISAVGSINLSQKFNLDTWLKLNPQVSATLKDASYNDTKKIHLTEVSGTLKLNGAALKLSTINARLNGIKTSFSGNIPNLLKAVAEPYPTMKIIGTLSVTDAVDYKQIEPLFANGEGKSKITYSVDLQTIVSRFAYVKFVAERASAQVIYSDNKLTANGLNFYSFDGRINTNLNYRFGKNRTLLCSGTVSDIDINQLFTTFDNFGQTYITSSNIDGKLSSTFNLRLPFSADKPDTKEMDFDAHINIFNGKLHGLEATNSIADFTKIDEFRNLEFSTLTNDITIANGKLNVPKMDVNCNACDISVYGQHGFDGNYEYHLKAVLSDFMRGKAKRLQQQNTPYGIVEEGTYTSVYLLATHIDGVTKIKFDRPEMKQQLKTEMQQQKQEVKQILKKEFGLFKKDTTIKVEEKKPQTGGFVIDWDGEDDDE